MTKEAMGLIIELDKNIKQWNEESEILIKHFNQIAGIIINAFPEAEKKEFYENIERMKTTKQITDNLIMELWGIGTVEGIFSKGQPDLKVIKGGKDKEHNQ